MLREDFNFEKDEMDMENRIVTTSYTAEDGDIDNSLRPKRLEDYIGQDKAKENLKIYIEAAKARGESLDHVLLYGPPGLGKTTLSNIIATEMGVNIRVTSGPAIEKQGDLAALLTNLSEGDVLFIDEIHRLPRTVEEILYPAMEDYALDIIIGKGPAARSIRIDLPHFTMIGATTRAGQLSTPLRDRFGVILRLELYTPEELTSIVCRSADILGITISGDGAYEIASRSRARPVSLTDCSSAFGISPRSKATAALREISPTTPSANWKSMNWDSTTLTEKCWKLSLSFMAAVLWGWIRLLQPSEKKPSRWRMFTSHILCR